MARVYNFSAGPAALPEAVMIKAASELTDYRGAGMSVMEMSHRGKDFMGIIEAAEKNLRSLMNIPENYKVLFLQGGASMQFSMVPLNLKKTGKADYVNTGQWTKKAISEAKKLGVDLKVIASSDDKTFSYIPKLNKADFRPDADYFYIATNNTIFGTVYNELPDTGDVPLIADASSNILSAPMDVSKFGIIFAGAQKNIGPAGLTIAIIREDLIGNAADDAPSLLNYATQAEAGSMYNTPPTYPIYIAGLVFEWLLEQGGVEAMQKKNEEKAAILYDYLDQSSLFSSPVAKEDRSLMNVPFVTGSDETDAKFIKEADAKNLKTLKGHRSVGGMRASIYNAMPTEGVKALVDFMKEFENNNT